MKLNLTRNLFLFSNKNNFGLNKTCFGSHNKKHSDKNNFNY